MTKKFKLKGICQTLIRNGEFWLAHKILTRLLIGKRLYIGDSYDKAWETGFMDELMDICGYSNRKYGLELWPV